MSHFSPRDIDATHDNSLLYDNFGLDNDDDAKLIESVRENGIREPLHVSSDGYLLSGHRRLAAARHLRLPSVPCIVANVEFSGLDDRGRLEVLRSFNLQRVKSPAERIREAMLDIDPEEAHRELLTYRAGRQRVEMESNIDMGDQKRRAKITTIEFLHGAQKVIRENRDYWPLTVRRVHYLLLNDPPLRHDSKPGSTYQNDRASYQALANLLVRARLSGEVPVAAIEDETRPVSVWGTHQEPEAFVADQADSLLKGYWRDLMQGQPHHVEILLEKNALRKVVERVGADYTIPVTTGRGYSSLSPRYAMVQRYKRSGRRRLVLLVLTDFDPDGEQIAASFSSSLRDDFGIDDVHAIKVALTADDVLNNDLPSDLEAKVSSPNYKKFVDRYGVHVVELDAAPVELLQGKLREAIESVIDVEEFNRQVEQEKQDQATIAARRKVVLEAMGMLGGGQ